MWSFLLQDTKVKNLKGKAKQVVGATFILRRLTKTDYFSKQKHNYKFKYSKNLQFCVKFFFPLLLFSSKPIQLAFHKHFTINHDKQKLNTWNLVSATVVERSKLSLNLDHGWGPRIESQPQQEHIWLKAYQRNSQGSLNNIATQNCIGQSPKGMIS